MHYRTLGRTGIKGGPSRSATPTTSLLHVADKNPWPTCRTTSPRGPRSNETGQRVAADSAGHAGEAVGSVGGQVEGEHQ
jgi:hypothetical protein